MPIRTRRFATVLTLLAALALTACRDGEGLRDEGPSTPAPTAASATAPSRLPTGGSTKPPSERPPGSESRRNSPSGPFGPTGR